MLNDAKQLLMVIPVAWGGRQQSPFITVECRLRFHPTVGQLLLLVYFAVMMFN